MSLGRLDLLLQGGPQLPSVSGVVRGACHRVGEVGRVFDGINHGLNIQIGRAVYDGRTPGHTRIVVLRHQLNAAAITIVVRQTFGSRGRNGWQVSVTTVFMPRMLVLLP